MSTAQLIYGLPSEIPDLLYAIGARVTDPLFLVVINGTPHAIVFNTEIDALKRRSKIRRILSYTDWFRKAKSENPKPGPGDVCATFLKAKKIRRVLVHPATPVFLTDELRKKGIRVDVGKIPFFPKRFIKTPAEVASLAASQKVTFQAIHLVETLLRRSRISKNRLLYRGRPLTSELLHTEAILFLTRNGYVSPFDIIVSCGEDSTEPHNRGGGLIRPHQFIIVDIFPQNTRTFMFGDATRTFCKGEPSAALARQYLTVKEAQEMAIRMIRPGVNGKAIHQAIHSLFKKHGYETGRRKGRDVGFFHGTGHGLGIAVHEEPLRINWSDCILKEGHVVTVEPGLYYPGVGGVRIEDVVLVTKTGAKVIGRYPKKLRLDY